MSSSCPKCGASKSGASCPKCGLVFAKFSSSVLEESVTEEIKVLWDAVEEKWTDETRHALFVEKALIGGAGAFAVSCYRKRGEDLIAQEYLARITKRLEQMLLASPRTRPRNQNRARWIGILLIFLVLVGLTMLFLSSLK